MFCCSLFCVCCSIDFLFSHFLLVLLDEAAVETVRCQIGMTGSVGNLMNCLRVLKTMSGTRCSLSCLRRVMEVLPQVLAVVMANDERVGSGGHTWPDACCIQDRGIESSSEMFATSTDP